MPWERKGEETGWDFSFRSLELRKRLLSEDCKFYLPIKSLSFSTLLTITEVWALRKFVPKRQHSLFLNLLHPTPKKVKERNSKLFAQLLVYSKYRSETELNGPKGNNPSETSSV